MTRHQIIPAILAATLLAATAVPAFAVAIKHTNRAEGDPDAVLAPISHAAPPADTTPAHALDKLHEDGSR